MSTTIDTLQIEIQSSSTNAAQGIKSLSAALGELKQNGKVTTAVNNLNNLRKALHSFSNIPSNASKVLSLASSLEKLKSVGSVGGVGNSLSKLATSMKTLNGVSVDKAKIDSIADALGSLSRVKAGGINTMMNGLMKLDQVTKSLNDDAINAFADRVGKLTAKLAPLSDKMTTVQAGLKGINSSAKKAGDAVEDMGEDLDTASLNMSSFIYTIQEAIQWVKQAIEKFSQLIGEAIEWDGIAARFGRGFGGQAQETYDWIKRLNEEMGINIQQFMKYSSVYSTMLTGFGVANEDAGKMALGYTELTYDIWAGYNDIYKNFDDAAEAIKSAIAGEVEPIRRAGFTIVESTLKQTAANHGLEISLEKATEAQKSYLRYLTLVDQAHAQGLVGTYAKEMNTAEGLVRTLTQQMKSLTQAFGSLFLPILVKVIPYVQAFVELLTDAVHWVAGLLGVTIQGVDWSGFNSGVGNAVENTDALGGAANDATKAVKELKNATLGIDELNVISPPSASAGSGVGGGAGDNGFAGLDVDSLWDETIFDDIQSDVDSIKEKLKDWLPVIATVAAAFAGLRLLKLITDINDVYQKLKLITGFGAAGVAGGGIFASIKEFFAAAKQMAPEVGWLAALFPKLSGWITSAASAVGSFLSGITAPAWATIAAVIAALAATVYFLYQKWDEVVQAVKNFFAQNISPKLEEIRGHFDKMAEALSPLAIALKPVFNFFKDLYTVVADFIKNIDWGEILSWLGKFVEILGGMIFASISINILSFVNVLVGAFENIVQFFSGWVQIVAGAIDFAVALFTGGDLKAAAEKMWGGVVDVFSGIVGLVVDPVIDMVEATISWFTEMWDILVGHSIVPDMINDIVKWFTGMPGRIIGSITQFVTDIVSKFKGLWSSLQKWWDSKPKLKEYTPSIGSIASKLSSAWTTAKNWWSKNRSSLSYTPSIGSIKDKLSSAWTTAKNWWNKSKGAMSYTPSIGSIKDKLSSAWSAAKSWWNKNVKLSIPSLKLKLTYSTDGLSKITKAAMKALGLPGLPKLSFAANGGIFDQGSLVWAGERGPEVVARAAGGKTGVMNVDQMQDAVYEGVYAAVVAAMRGSSGNDGGQSVNVYLDGRQISAAIEKRQRERGATLLGNQVYAY